MINRNITKIARTTNILLNKQLSSCNLGIEEFECLHIIKHNSDISFSELANLMLIDKSVMSRRVNKLINKGYVFFNLSKIDSRIKCLNLTDSGKLMCDKKIAIERAFYSYLFSKVDNKDLERFYFVLNQIYQESKIEKENDFRGFLNEQ